ncbi:MAG: acyl-CoA dehydratase activase [Anaerolineae bacterium]
MITAGIDVGAKTTKVVIMNDGQVLGRSNPVLTGFDQQEAAEKAMAEALAAAGLEQGAIERTVATGAGAKAVPFANDAISDVKAAARGANFFFPSARTVIDVGAEEGRGIRCDEKGMVIDFAVNEKCAAGAGAFTEAMSRALEVPLEEMGGMSLKSQNAVPMNAQCAVFAESEVVSLIHAKTPKQDIVRAVHDAIASRIGSMVRRVGVERDAALIGGVAHNIGFVDALRRGLELEILVPEEPDYVSAVGAALVAAGD